MTDYKCGHKTDGVIILDGTTVLSITAYFEWSETVGVFGDRSECWDCWCDDRGVTEEKCKCEFCGKELEDWEQKHMKKMKWKKKSCYLCRGKLRPEHLPDYKKGSP